MRINTLKEAERVADHFLRQYPSSALGPSPEVVERLVPFCWTLGIQARKAWLDLGVDPTVVVSGKQLECPPRYHESRPQRPGAHWVVWADKFVLDVAAGIQGPHLPTPFVWERM